MGSAGVQRNSGGHQPAEVLKCRGMCRNMRGHGSNGGGEVGDGHRSENRLSESSGGVLADTSAGIPAKVPARQGLVGKVWGKFQAMGEVGKQCLTMTRRTQRA